LPVDHRADTDEDDDRGKELGEAAIGARRSRLAIMIDWLERAPHRRPSRFDMLLIVEVVSRLVHWR
jgi:hypothetical protein